MVKRRAFLKNMTAGTIGLAAMINFPGCKPRSKQDSVGGLYTPESQGVSSQGLIDFLDAVGKSNLEFHSIMINRNGKTILEGWWDPFRKPYHHTLYSLSKSFTSTAIGMLHDAGKLDTDMPVVSFFPDQLPVRMSDNLSAMRIYDLLTMHTGHDQDTMGPIRTSGENDWVKAFLRLEVPHNPGSHFLYNTGATYMLSAIVQKITGQNTMAYLTPRLFEPLGIVGADWEEDPNGINVGGYGLRLRTEDILNFGQLYLQQGQWNGEQLISPQWIAEATRKQVNSQDNNSDWGQGYGYQFWMCKPGCYRGDGAFGQYCIVVPDKNAVIAITSESKDMGASMQLVWDHILPALRLEAMPDNPVLHQSLTERSEKLKLPIAVHLPATGNPTGIAGKTYSFAANTYHASDVTFNFKGDDGEFVFRENGKTILVKSGLNQWITGDQQKPGNSLFPIRGRTPMPTLISSHFCWTDETTLVIHLKYVENAHTDMFTFKFSDNILTLTFNNSVSQFNNTPDERPALEASLSG